MVQSRAVSARDFTAQKRFVLPNIDRPRHAEAVPDPGSE